MDAVTFAVSITLRCGSRQIAVPILIRGVAFAVIASTTNGSIGACGTRELSVGRA
jgi:hypothetical protein